MSLSSKFVNSIWSKYLALDRLHIVGGINKTWDGNVHFLSDRFPRQRGYNLQELSVH